MKRKCSDGEILVDNVCRTQSSVDLSPWRLHTSHISPDYSIKNPEKGDYRMSIEYMSPDEFLDIQRRLYNKTHPNFVTRQEHEDALYTDKIEPLRKQLREGGMDIPYLEYEPSGKQTPIIEGRHRALAAKLEGIEKIPVLKLTFITKETPDSTGGWF